MEMKEYFFIAKSILLIEINLKKIIGNIIIKLISFKILNHVP